MPGLIGLLGEDEAELKADLIAYQAGIAGWPQAGVPASADIVAAIAKLLAALDQTIVDIESNKATTPISRPRRRSIGCWSYRESGTSPCGRELSWGNSLMP